MAQPNVKDDEKFSDAEAARRVETALRAAFNAPHKTYKESKIGKRKALPRKSPGKRRPVEKSG
jgi:hypothetical protein